MVEDTATNGTGNGSPMLIDAMYDLNAKHVSSVKASIEAHTNSEQDDLNNALHLCAKQ